VKYVTGWYLARSLAGVAACAVAVKRSPVRRAIVRMKQRDALIWMALRITCL
jgi:hypothetical protein